MLTSPAARLAAAVSIAAGRAAAILGAGYYVSTASILALGGQFER